MKTYYYISISILIIIIVVFGVRFYYKNPSSTVDFKSTDQSNLTTPSTILTPTLTTVTSVPNLATPPFLYWSTENTNFTRPQSQSSIAYSPELQTTVISSFNDSILVIRKNNTWQSKSLTSTGFTGTPPMYVIWVSTWQKFILISSSKAGYSSTDGITWEVFNLDEQTYGKAACWSSDLNIVLSTRYVDQGMIISENGTKWEPLDFTFSNIQPNSSIDWNSICWANRLKLFVAVGGFASDTNLTTQKIMISNDGRNWTLIDLQLSLNLTSIAWSEELGLLVAVSRESSIITSTNGYNWTNYVLPNSNATGWTSVCWSATANTFVAVSSKGYVAMSSNGNVWTLYSLPGTWQQVAWLPDKNRFMTISRSQIVAYS